MMTVEASEKLRVEIYNAIEKFAHRVGNVLVRETVKAIDENDVRASADLRKSITYEVKLFGTFVVITVFSPLNYAVYAHEGRKPGRMPPIEPIQRWVRMKGIAGRYSVKTKRRMGTATSRWKEDEQAAWAIARSIAKKGTKGVKFFEIALRNALPKLERLSVVNRISSEY